MRLFVKHMSGGNAIVNWSKEDEYEKEINIEYHSVQDLDMRHLTSY